MNKEIELPPHQPPKRTNVTVTLKDLAAFEDRQGGPLSNPCMWNDQDYPCGTIVRSNGKRYQCAGFYWLILDDE